MNHPMSLPENTDLSWIDQLLSPDPFETQNFMHDNRVNGTTKSVFDRRNDIDRKNLVNAFLGDYGMQWVSSYDS